MACPGLDPDCGDPGSGGFFLSVLSPDAKAPNGFIYLAYVGAVVLAVGVLVILSVYLRQRGSPESKPVHEPHHATGAP